MFQTISPVDGSVYVERETATANQIDDDISAFSVDPKGGLHPVPGSPTMALKPTTSSPDAADAASNRIVHCRLSDTERPRTRRRRRTDWDDFRPRG